MEPEPLAGESWESGSSGGFAKSMTRVIVPLHTPSVTPDAVALSCGGPWAEGFGEPM